MLQLPPHFCRRIEKEKNCVFKTRNIITKDIPTFQKWNAYFLRRCRLHLIAYSSHHIRFLNIFHQLLRSYFCNRKKAADELCISYCWPCTAYFHLVSISSWNSFLFYVHELFFNFININKFWIKSLGLIELLLYFTHNSISYKHDPTLNHFLF